MSDTPETPPDAGQSLMYDFAVLRELRKRESLTIEEVAVRAGLSPAVISKLERNQTTASLETLYRLGRVFGMSATDLLGLAESPLAHRKRDHSHTSDGFTFRKIAYANFAALLGTAPAGARVSRPEVHHDDHETCWVLSGRIRLVLPNETIELGAGESTQFDAIQHHTYEALEDTTLIIVQIAKAKRY